jgi:glycosyltransferase involved in cell wall biosynthesis
VLEDVFDLTIGNKRNVLVNLATGKFLAFIDDDDRIADDYCKTIIDVINSSELGLIKYILNIED